MTRGVGATILIERYVAPVISRDGKIVLFRQFVDTATFVQDAGSAA